MELHQIQQQLIEHLEKEYTGKVIHNDIWCIPVHTFQIKYQPIQKKAMDILMKIMLFSFQKSSFESAEQLSEILLVEPLFVENLIRKMQKNGLLERNQHIYQLTEKGKHQFSKDEFEEELDPVTTELLYSPVHEGILEGNIEDVLDFDDFPDKMYDYLPEETEEVNENFMLQQIQSMQFKDETQDNNVIEIKSILSMEHTQTNDVPCIEFVVSKEENKELFTRIWNTLYNDWDNVLEKQLMDKK